MKRSLVALVVLAMVAVSMPFQARGETPALKIAYVDLKRVMLESEKGKEARKGLTDEFEKRKKEIAQKQGELQKIKDALEKGADMMTPEARSEKEKQYQTKLKNYQRIANDYQSEIQQKDQELTQKVLKELEEIIKGMGDQDRYTLILEKNHAGILFGLPAIDITEKVIAQYNQTAKKKPATPKKY